MNKEPSVSVIVLNYNGIRYLEACLSSLRSQSYNNYEIIVYDNASTDVSVKFINQNFPEVVLIQGKRNVGFAKANNVAIDFALEKNSDFVFLVNNDTSAENTLIERLVANFQKQDSLGIISPAVFNLYDRHTLQELGMTIDKFGYPLAIKSSKDQARVFFVSGCAMMIKSEVLRKIGAFDEKYFMFAEDLDLCWRAQLAGYKVAVDEKAKIFHVGGGTLPGGVATELSYETNARRVFLREKNTLRTLLKNYDNENLLKIFPLSIILLCFEAFFWLSILKAEVGLSELNAIYYNIKFLPDTLQQRRFVQTLRKVSDREIQKTMIRGNGKLLFISKVGLPRFHNSE